MNRTIVEKARSMLLEAGLSKEFWAEAVNTAVYLINRSPTKVVAGKTPEEAFSGKKPNLSNLKVFGAKALVYIPKQLRKKLDGKTKECIFMGYSDDIKGYRLYDGAVNDTIFSRDVVFFERTDGTDTEENAHPKTVPHHQTTLNNAEDDDVNAEEDDVNAEEDDVNEDEEIASERDNSEFDDDESEYFTDTSNDASNDDTVIEAEAQSSNYESTVDTDDSSSGPVEVPQVAGVRRSERTPKPRKMDDYVTYFTNEEIMPDPMTIEEAMSRPDKELWKQAIQSELQSLKENDTWMLVDRPKNQKILGTKWVFKTKRNADGEVERYKARLFAQGFSQIRGVDYDEIYSPVVRHNSVKLLLALAAKYDLEIHHVDVTTAYLQGDLEENIYINQPGTDKDENKVV
jgi:hypothetical protein